MNHDDCPGCNPPRRICDCEFDTHDMTGSYTGTEHAYGIQVAHTSPVKTAYGVFNLCSACYEAGHMQVYVRIQGRTLNLLDLPTAQLVDVINAMYGMADAIGKAPQGAFRSAREVLLRTGKAIETADGRLLAR